MRRTFMSLCSVPAAALAVAVLTAACNTKDSPPKPLDEPKKTTPVPSDMTFNEFLPSSGEAQGLAVRVDGGVLEAGAGAAAAQNEAAQGEAAGKLKVVDPGAEPRAVRKYAFVANRADRRVVTVRKSAAQQGGPSEDIPPLALTIEFVPKDVKPAGTRFEMKVLKVDLADREKLDKRLADQATAELATFAGLKGTFDVGPRGAIGEVSFAGNEKMQRPGAQEVLESIQQAIELMLPELPEAPIGIGAKWERATTLRERGIEQTTHQTYELKEAASDGAVVTAAIQTKVPRRALPDPRMKGATVEVEGAGNYTYNFRFDHIATKVSGELTNTMKIEVPTPDGAGGAAGGQGKAKQTVVQEIKLKHQMEPAAGAAPSGAK